MPCKLTLGELPMALVPHPYCSSAIPGKDSSPSGKWWMCKFLDARPGQCPDLCPELGWHPALNWIAYHYFALVWQQIFALSLGRAKSGKKVKEKDNLCVLQEVSLMDIPFNCSTLGWSLSILFSQGLPLPGHNCWTNPIKQTAKLLLMCVR